MNIILKNAIKIITINSFSPLNLNYEFHYSSLHNYRECMRIFLRKGKKKSPFSMKLTNPKVSR